MNHVLVQSCRVTVTAVGEGTAGSNYRTVLHVQKGGKIMQCLLPEDAFVLVKYNPTWYEDFRVEILLFSCQAVKL